MDTDSDATLTALLQDVGVQQVAAILAGPLLADTPLGRMVTNEVLFEQHTADAADRLVSAFLASGGRRLGPDMHAWPLAQDVTQSLGQSR